MIPIQSFWWPHCLLAALTLGLATLAVWLFSVKGKNKASPPLDHRWQGDVEEIPEEPDNLMGKALLEEGVSIVSAEDFGFTDKTVQLGAVPDIQQDIREICKVLADRDGSKEDFFSMFVLIREKYPKLRFSPVLPELAAFIRETVPFQLSPEELENLWN